MAYPEAASSSIRQLAAIIIIDKRHSARHDMDRRRRTEGKGRKSDDTKKKSGRIRSTEVMWDDVKKRSR